MRQLMSAVLLTCLGSAGATLSAQNLAGGLYTGFSLPEGDLKDRQYSGTNQSVGSHVGGYFDFDLAPRHRLRVHLTFQNFPGSTWPHSYEFFHKNAFTALQGGADWIYHFRGGNHGWYTLAGASLNSVWNERDYAFVTGPWYAPQGYQVNGTQRQLGRAGLRAGGGYTFTRTFSLEGTVNEVYVDKHGPDGFGFDFLTWVQVSAVFRFGK